jgi:hypothetical protein
MTQTLPDLMEDTYKAFNRGDPDGEVRAKLEDANSRLILLSQYGAHELIEEIGNVSEETLRFFVAAMARVLAELNREEK